jgi:hypothetical protein
MVYMRVRIRRKILLRQKPVADRQPTLGIATAPAIYIIALAILRNDFFAVWRSCSDTFLAFVNNIHVRADVLQDVV